MSAANEVAVIEALKEIQERGFREGRDATEFLALGLAIAQMERMLAALKKAANFTYTGHTSTDCTSKKCVCGYRAVTSALAAVLATAEGVASK